MQGHNYMNALMPPTMGQPRNALTMPHELNYDAWRSALQGWHDQRPEMGALDPAAFHQALLGWKGTRPERGSFFGQPQTPQTNPGTQGPQVPTTQFPLNPGAPVQGQQFPMVGSSYNVLGMNPATSPFGLPTY